MNSHHNPSPSICADTSRIRRIAILKKAEALLIASLEIDESGARCSVFNPTSNPILMHHSFDSSAQALDWLTNYINAQTEKGGWNLAYDGAPMDDPDMSANPLMLLAILQTEEAPVTAEEMGAKSGEASTVLITRSDMIGSLTLQDHRGGALVHRTVNQMSYTLMTIPQPYRCKEEAATAFNEAREALGLRGWKEFYVGPPLQG